jgi:hypothetical protein
VNSATNTTYTLNNYGTATCTDTPTTTSFITPIAPTCSDTYTEETCLSAPATSSGKSAGCFAGSESVERNDWVRIEISKVVVGDRILAASKSGVFSFAEVIAVPHGFNQIPTNFVSIVMENGDLSLTPDHLVLASKDCYMEPRLFAAIEINVAFCLMTTKGYKPVISKTMRSGLGAYTVVTTEEFIVINGVVASPFALNHAIGNSFYGVLRVLHKMFPSVIVSKTFIS